MKKSVKAVLLSALVFPGVGHLLLKKRIAGLVLISAASITVYLLFSQVLSASQSIVEKIQTGEVAADIVAISDLVHQQLSGNEGESMHNILMMFLVTWIVGMLDIIRIGRQIDKQAK